MFCRFGCVTPLLVVFRPMIKKICMGNISCERISKRCCPNKDMKGENISILGVGMSNENLKFSIQSKLRYVRPQIKCAAMTLKLVSLRSEVSF